MGLRKEFEDFHREVSGVFNRHASNIYNLERLITRQEMEAACLQTNSEKTISGLRGEMESELQSIFQTQDKLATTIRELKTQITNLKQEICGLKTGHKFIFQEHGECVFAFQCKLCGKCDVKWENELTPVERKALRTLGILNGQTKKRSDKSKSNC